MTVARIFKYAAVALGVLGLSACAPQFSANVARFQQLPPAQGQSFAIEATDPSMSNSLEFASYAALVSAELARFGYVPTSGGSSDLVVKLDYDVDQGRERIRRSSNFYDPFYYDPFYYGGYGRGFGRGSYRPSVLRTRSGYRYVGGFYDPFLFGAGYSGFNDVTSYTVFTSGLDLAIERRADGTRLFEGKASAQSRDNDLTYLVPNLIGAMFTGFPGNNAERVRITLPPKEDQRG